MTAIAPSSIANMAVVSETVGQVAQYVVTSREVRIVYGIEKVLFPDLKKSESSSLDLMASVGESQFQAALTAVLLEVVVATEAQAFNLAELTDEELASSIAKVQSSAGFKERQARLEISQDEIQRFIKRKLIAKKFLKFKTNSMVGSVSDADVKSYYDQNRSKFTGEAFDAYKEKYSHFLDAAAARRSFAILV